MHECPECGQACDCDGEDTWFDNVEYCTCDHEGSGYDSDEWEDDDFEADPCDTCGPWCSDWGGDGLCMAQIRAQADADAELARIEKMSKTRWGRFLLDAEEWHDHIMGRLQSLPLWKIVHPIDRCHTCGKIERVLFWYIGDHPYCLPF